MTQLFCDNCKRPLGVIPDESFSMIAILCSKCEKIETLENSSILNYWSLLEVGQSGTATRKGLSFTCELVKTRPGYVVIAVTPEESPCAVTYILLTKSYKNNRINMLVKDRYSYGYGSRDFVIQLLTQIAEKERLKSASQTKVDSIYWDALKQVYSVKREVKM
ncbi:MAG: hypothetical protein ACTSXA_06425 [Candidatus Heimdallarchaeota archaeon]